MAPGRRVLLTLFLKKLRLYARNWGWQGVGWGGWRVSDQILCTAHTFRLRHYMQTLFVLPLMVIMMRSGSRTVIWEKRRLVTSG